MQYLPYLVLFLTSGTLLFGNVHVYGMEQQENQEIQFSKTIHQFQDEKFRNIHKKQSLLKITEYLHEFDCVNFFESLLTKPDPNTTKEIVTTKNLQEFVEKIACGEKNRPHKQNYVNKITKFEQKKGDILTNVFDFHTFTFTMIYTKGKYVGSFLSKNLKNFRIVQQGQHCFLHFNLSNDIVIFDRTLHHNDCIAFNLDDLNEYFCRFTTFSRIVSKGIPACVSEDEMTQSLNERLRKENDLGCKKCFCVRPVRGCKAILFLTNKNTLILSNQFDNWFCSWHIKGTPLDHITPQLSSIENLKITDLCEDGIVVLEDKSEWIFHPCNIGVDNPEVTVLARAPDNYITGYFHKNLNSKPKITKCGCFMFAKYLTVLWRTLNRNSRKIMWFIFFLISLTILLQSNLKNQETRRLRPNLL